MRFQRSLLPTILWFEPCFDREPYFRTPVAEDPETEVKGKSISANDMYQTHTSLKSPASVGDEGFTLARALAVKSHKRHPPEL